MWSSVTERRIGTAGVSSTDTAGSSDASPRSVSKTDWISRADVRARDGIVADMRRDDLGSQGEKLTAIDALVVGHPGPLCWRSRRSGEVIGAHLRLRMLREQYWSSVAPTSRPMRQDHLAPLSAGDTRKAQSRGIRPRAWHEPRPALADRGQAPPGGLHLPVGLARCSVQRAILLSAA